MLSLKEIQAERKMGLSLKGNPRTANRYKVSICINNEEIVILQKQPFSVENVYHGNDGHRIGEFGEKSFNEDSESSESDKIYDDEKINQLSPMNDDKSMERLLTTKISLYSTKKHGVAN